MTKSEIIWLCALCVPLGGIMLLKLLFFVKGFAEELRYINGEITRTCGNEHRRWVRRKQRLWRSLLLGANKRKPATVSAAWHRGKTVKPKCQQKKCLYIKQKPVKRALLTSALFLLVCVSMLVGATYAWFTVELNSNNNVLATGNLDVELTHTNREKNEESVTQNEALFTDVGQWEPGAVAYEKLTITNTGTLALKYQLAINVVATNGVEVDGESHTLADALRVSFVDAEKLDGTCEAAIAAGNEAGWDKLSSVVKSDVLRKQNDTSTYGIVIYWMPTANDNIWNLYNGQKADDGAEKLSVELGVHLTATQLVEEKDSYGDQYDAESEYPLPTGGNKP